MVRSAIEAPPWIVGLPRDGRGFHVPAEAPWAEGQPRLSLMGTDQKVALAFTRSCAVCGFQIAPGNPVYRAFSQADAAAVRVYQRDFAQDLGGPAHRSCMLYSALVCPYLKEPTARLGKASLVSPGQPRGKLAAVMGFEDALLMIFAAPHLFLADDAPPPQFGYQRLVEDLPYRDSDQLREVYEDAVKEDNAQIDVNVARAYWRDQEADATNKAKLIKRGHRRLGTATPALNALILGDPYFGFSLPVL